LNFFRIQISNLKKIPNRKISNTKNVHLNDIYNFLLDIFPIWICLLHQIIISSPNTNKWVFDKWTRCARTSIGPASDVTPTQQAHSSGPNFPLRPRALASRRQVGPYATPAQAIRNALALSSCSVGERGKSPIFHSSPHAASPQRAAASPPHPPPQRNDAAPPITASHLRGDDDFHHLDRARRSRRRHPRTSTHLRGDDDFHHLDGARRSRHRHPRTSPSS
jgi:hypothetical protein